MFEIKLFGTGQASNNGNSLVDFPNQQPSLLLCYLLLNNHYPHHREHISSIFWGDSPTKTARKRLRNALWRLRNTLKSVGASCDDFLLITDDTISFIDSSDYWLDIEIFENQTECVKGISGGDLIPEQVSKLELAVNLYVGDLLEGCYEDWLLNDREKFRIAYINTLNKLMVYYGKVGNYERGLSCGEKILSQDFTREKVHRQIMQLHFLAGNRDASLAQYHRCREILWDEFGIPPMKDTRTFYELLLRNQLDPKPWSDDFITSSPAESNYEFSIYSLVRSALQKLHRLQETIEDTSSELLQIEQMITEAITNSTQQPENSSD